MTRLIAGALALILLVGCGADGAPTKPTKPVKERLEEKAAAEAAETEAEVLASEES